MNEFDQTIVKTRESILETNKVLKNTYMLLSMTLIFSAIMAYMSMKIVTPQNAMFLGLGSTIAAIAILWLVMPRFEESTGYGGIVVAFIFTGLLGLGLGPLLYVAMAKGGTQIIATALGGTGVIFLALSGYALTTKKDFTFLGGFLFAGLIILIIAAVLNIFLKVTGLALVIDVVALFIFSGLILFDTSRIIHGGEDNYIRATVALYLNIYNIFVHLLHLLMHFSGDD